MITVVARWETDSDLADCEYRLWIQLQNFGIDRFVFVPQPEEMSHLSWEQYATMPEALATVQGNRVFMESTGTKGMNDLPSREEDVVFIFGNTNQNNLAHAQAGELYRIQEPMVTDMYQTSAAAVALAFWHGQ